MSAPEILFWGWWSFMVAVWAVFGWKAYKAGVL